MPGLQSGNEASLVGVARVLGCKDAAELGALRPSRLMKLTQRDLLEAARILGLTRVTRLNKEALLARVWDALQGAGIIPPDEPAAVASARRSPVAAAPAPAVATAAPALAKPGNGAPAAWQGPISVKPDRREAEDSPPAAAHKFDVGEGTGKRADAADEDFARLRAEAQAHIPWSYAQNKVTALPVDPDRLFVYWEVTQPAIDQARAGLGPGGQDAWLSLRVYDVTGRLFDGNNAHGYFDQGVGSDVRQWFFHIGKPTSQAVVEIGLKSHEGYFVKIARSGRLEFPRNEPVGWSDPEWMTVQVHTGAVEQTSASPWWQAGGAGSGAGTAPYGQWTPGQVGGPGPGDPAAFSSSESFDHGAGLRRRIWIGRSQRELGELGGEAYDTWSWEEVDGESLSPEILQAFSWEGDSEFTSWEAGPFEHPVEIPALIKESYSGPAKIFRSGGRTHVVWGPWQVLIKGLGAHAERKVISRWQMERAFTTRVWREITTGGPGVTPLGSSGLGASERWGRAGSELRLAGASERFLVGASELRFAGASERAFAGASQWLMRGASERLLRGSSELGWGGSSERRLGGSSERRFAGASERRLGGGSEQRLGGSDEPAAAGSAYPEAALASSTSPGYGWPALADATPGPIPGGRGEGG